MNTPYTVYLGDYEVNLTIEFSLSDASPARGFDPADGGDIEDRTITIDEVLDEDGNEVTLDAAGLALMVSQIEAKFDAELDAAAYDRASNYNYGD